VHREKFPARLPMALDVRRGRVRAGLPGRRLFLWLVADVVRGRYDRTVHGHTRAALVRRILARDPEEGRPDGPRPPSAPVVREHGPTDFSRHRSREEYHPISVFPSSKCCCFCFYYRLNIFYVHFHCTYS